MTEKKRHERQPHEDAQYKLMNSMESRRDTQEDSNIAKKKNNDSSSWEKKKQSWMDDIWEEVRVSTSS